MAVGRIRAGLEALQRDAELRERINKEAADIFAKKRAKDAGEKIHGMEVSGVIVDELDPTWVMGEPKHPGSVAEWIAREEVPDRESMLDRRPTRGTTRVSREALTLCAEPDGKGKLISSQIKVLMEKMRADIAPICRQCDLAKFEARDEADLYSDCQRIEARLTCSAPRCAKDVTRPIRIHETGRATRAKNYTMPTPEPAPEPAPRTPYGDW